MKLHKIIFKVQLKQLQLIFILDDLGLKPWDERLHEFLQGMLGFESLKHLYN